MTAQNNLFAQPINTAALIKHILIGGGIALLLISLFLLGVDNPNPAWPKYWWIRPMLVVPFAGAVGGAFSYYMDYITKPGTTAKVLAVIVSIIVYIIGLWMGSVLGLDGTLWN
ncbi:MAG: potassium transporter KefB [Saprospiraceae bacterium]|nr:potassium transporter KefB [Saprospiraceae bacterium]